eukprot:6485537-Amphidinium_carterae.3
MVQRAILQWPLTSRCNQAGCAKFHTAVEEDQHSNRPFPVFAFKVPAALLQPFFAIEQLSNLSHQAIGHTLVINTSGSISDTPCPCKGSYWLIP